MIPGAVSDLVEVAHLDQSGVIVAVNDAWVDFCADNGGDPARCGIGRSYLAACLTAPDDDAARQVHDAIQTALAGDSSPPVTIQIECDSPTEPRSFDVLVSSRHDEHDGRRIGATVTLSRSAASTHLELARLIGELNERAHDLLRIQGRLMALLRFNADVATEPTLAAVEQRLFAAARELLTARSVRLSQAPLDPAAGQAELSQPIEIRGEVFAYLIASDRATGQFDDDDLQLAGALTAAAAVAIDNIRLTEAADEQRRWQQISAEACRLLLADPERATIEVVCHYAGLAARASAAVVTTDPRPERPVEGPGLRLAAPLAGRPNSVLVVRREPGAAAFAPGDLDQLVIFADRVGTALELAITPRGSS